MRLVPAHRVRGKFDQISAFNEDRNDGCGLVHALIPPIDSRVKEDGDLLGYVVVVKFIDYNLGDSKTYPHFRPDQYLTIQKNPRTGANEYVPMEHV